MGWDFEIPHTSNNELSDIEVGSLYRLKAWSPKNISTTLFKKTDTIIIPLRRLTYNMNTGDTEQF